MITHDSNTLSRKRLYILVVSMAALVGSMFTVGRSAEQADAWAWDPHVAVTGRATCSPMIGSKVSWMWWSASNGEQGWATLYDAPANTRRYRFDLYRVPTNGVTVTVKWGCSGMGETKAGFGVNRPSTGYYTTRNLCPTWWGRSSCVI